MERVPSKSDARRKVVRILQDGFVVVAQPGIDGQVGFQVVAVLDIETVKPFVVVQTRDSERLRVLVGESCGVGGIEREDSTGRKGICAIEVVVKGDEAVEKLEVPAVFQIVLCNGVRKRVDPLESIFAQ